MDNTPRNDAIPPTAQTGDGAQMVTASDLVRNFGVWQERAARAPVYVLNRGRPRHVLTSVDIMHALCAPHNDDASKKHLVSIATLLDFTDDVLVIADAKFCVTGLSLPARSFFSGDVQPGTLVDRFVTSASAPMLNDAVARVMARGSTEAVDIVASRYPERQLYAVIAPCLGGTIIKLHDATLADDLRALRAEISAEEEAIRRVGDVARATINLRGYLASDSPSLAQLTALPQQSLASARFVSLFEIASRSMLGDAVEAVIGGRNPGTIDATLLVNRADPRAVRVGLGAVRCGSAVTSVSAIVVATGTG